MCNFTIYNLAVTKILNCVFLYAKVKNEISVGRELWQLNKDKDKSKGVCQRS